MAVLRILGWKLLSRPNQNLIQLEAFWFSCTTLMINTGETHGQNFSFIPEMMLETQHSILSTPIRPGIEGRL